MDKTRKNILKIYFAIGIVGFSYYMYIRLTGHALSCPFHEMTGMYCPGCGITRAAVSLIHLDFYHALRNHLAFCLDVFLWIVISLLAFIGKPRIFRNAKFNIIILYVSIGLFILFGVIRNFPQFEILLPLDGKISV